jgi:hypothetical protein
VITITSDAVSVCDAITFGDKKNDRPVCVIHIVVRVTIRIIVTYSLILMYYNNNIIISKTFSTGSCYRYVDVGRSENPQRIHDRRDSFEHYTSLDRRLRFGASPGGQQMAFSSTAVCRWTFHGIVRRFGRLAATDFHCRPSRRRQMFSPVAFRTSADSTDIRP